MEVKIVNNSKHSLPTYATMYSAGMDLRADIDGDIVIKPLERVLIPTNIKIQLPIGYEAQVRARSGLALKYGITVLNGVGTIDSDYIGNVGVILVNLSNEPFTVKDGERIAQMVVAKHESVTWNSVDVLGDTERGNGGFGSSGIK